MTADDRVKFATYRRDSESSLDYAGNRYYDNVTGRFMTADPYLANSGGPGNVSDPQSWNRYAYTRGDPVNRYDPAGLIDWAPGFYTGSADNLWVGSIGPLFPVWVGFGGGGGGKTVLAVNNLQKSGKNYDQVTKTLQKILDSIDSNCLSFLQSGGQNLQSYVSDLLSSNLLATGSFAVNIAAFTGTGGTSLAAGQAAIVVNNYGAFFNSGWVLDQGKIQGGTSEADAFILLHELGHALDANGFQSDLNNWQAGNSNDKLIDQHCQKTLSQFQ